MNSPVQRLHAVVFNSASNARMNISASEDNEVGIDTGGPAKFWEQRNMKSANQYVDFRDRAAVLNLAWTHMSFFAIC